MRVVLGVGAHVERAAAAVLIDGKIAASISGERFTRLKHDSTLPTQAIMSCLKKAGINPSQVDAVALPYSLDLILRQRSIPLITGFPKSLNWLKGYSSSMTGLFSMKRQLNEQLGIRADIHHIPHHLSHAAAVWRMSSRRRAMILVLDGMGEYASTSLYFAWNGRIKKILSIPFPHSLGYLYEGITTYLGFGHWDPGKTMGLSSYGDASRIPDFNCLVEHLPRGEYRLNMKYFAFQHGHTAEGWRTYLSSQFIDKFGPPRICDSTELTQRHCDFAAAVQNMLEETVLRLVKAHLPEKWALCVGGGVALNCLMNSKLCDLVGPEDFFVMPAADDCGTALGAALVADSSLKRKTFE